MDLYQRYIITAEVKFKCFGVERTIEYRISLYEYYDYMLGWLAYSSSLFEHNTR